MKVIFDLNQNQNRDLIQVRQGKPSLQLHSACMGGLGGYEQSRRGKLETMEGESFVAHFKSALEVQ